MIPRIHEETSLADPNSVRAWLEGSAPEPESTNDGTHAVRLHPLRAIDEPAAVPLRPAPEAAFPKVSLERAVVRRGSSRAFTGDPINLDQLATLLEYSIRPIRTDYRRTAALVEPYLIVNAVEGLASGVYRLIVTERDPRLRLQEVRLGDFRSHAAQLALDQALGGDAAVDIYFMTDLRQAVRTYGERGYRLAQMEAAVMAGRGYLAAYALGIGASGLTFYDELVEDFLEVSGEGLKVMFLLAVGVPVKDHR
jgi:SagB-type dehydrogenase family enzyme